jgi:hypothetical protein
VSTFLIVLLVVVAFVVGQMTMLRPSARDSRLMALRAEARRLGMSARLLPPPEWYRGERPTGGLLACYSLVDADQDKGFPYFRAERLADGEWWVRSGEKRLLAELTLPEAASALIAIEAQANAVSLWWTESLDVSAISSLLQILQDLRGKAAK